MKTFALNRISLAAALLVASATSFAQTPSNPFALPGMPTLPAGSLDLANLAAQQAQLASDLISKVHAQTDKVTRELMGSSAEELNPDELEAALVARIPGFAGWIHREDGTTVMRLAGIKAADAATALSRLPSAASLIAAAGSKVTVQAAQWDSRQLLDFKDKAFSLASLDGVLATWINRETNRVEIRYNSDLDPSAIEALTNQLVGAGIPRAAMVLTPGEIARASSATGVSLQSQTLPLAAGSQIFGEISSTKSEQCTLGVPAIRSGVRGFVTASHCSSTTYGTDTISRFADSKNTTVIGTESVDPKGTTCPSIYTTKPARGCRKADALFVKTSVSNAVDFGKLLVTPGANNVTASKIINITGSQANPTVGQTVYKTGRTTGTTSAKVARICANALVTDVSKNTYGIVCQVEVDSAGFSAGGDSGGPVWLSSNGAVITGIVAYEVVGGVARGFSPWGAVTSELGGMTIK